MTLLEQHKKAFGENPDSQAKEELLATVKMRNQSLDSEYSARISKYRTFNRFFHGDQWFRVDRDASRHKYTNNMCEPIVTKYASLLLGDAPGISVPRASETALEEDIAGFEGFGEETPDFASDENRSEILEKILRRIIYTDNPGAKIFYEGSKAGSLYGDTVLYTDYDEKKDTFKIQNVFPGYVRAAWAQDDFNELDFVVIQHIVSVAQVHKKYGVMVDADDPAENTDLVWDTRRLDNQDHAIIRTYWDDEVKITWAGDTILETKKHKHKRVPFWFISNREDPYHPWGMSDLEDILALQERLNIAISNQADIIELFANPKIILKNGTQRDIEALKSVKGNVIPLRRDADMQPFQFTGQIFPIQQEISDVRQAIHDISGLPPVFFGNAQGSIVTGVALSAQAAPTLQIVNAKGLGWTRTLQEMFSFMLETLEKRGGKVELAPGKKRSYKDIINGNYAVKVSMNVRTPRDDGTFIQNELNKMNFRVQSRLTTMEKLGIESGDDELKRIAFEEAHPLYTANPENLVDNLQIPSGMDEEAQLSFSENDQLETGEQVEAVADSIDGHQLHIEVHSRFFEDNPEMTPEAKQAFDAHMAGHEAALNENPNTPQIKGRSAQAGETNFPTQGPGLNQAEDINNPTLPEGGAGQTVALPVEQGGNAQQGL